MKSGTGDVQKIARLRRASLQPDSKAPSAASPAQLAAQAMAEAVAEEDGESTGAQRSISVTFGQHGTLGLKFTPNKQTNDTEILAVNAGTQAEQHRELQPGLILMTIAGVSVSGKRYPEVIDMIKRSGRPLTLTFRPGGTMASAASPRDEPRPQQQPPPDPTANLTGKAAQKALQESK